MTYLNKFFGHLKNVLEHKYWVFYYSCQLGIPWQGFKHDLSKFSPTEFFESVKYYQGDSSPIPACKKINGYSLAWQHHKGRNPHHYEYWTDNYDSGMNPIQMPSKYVLEMIADWFAAGRTYKGKHFTMQDEYDWWINKRDKLHPTIHPNTIKVINELMDMAINFDSLNIIRHCGGVHYVNKLYNDISEDFDLAYVNTLNWDSLEKLNILYKTKFWKSQDGRFELVCTENNKWNIHIDDGDFDSVGHSRIETIKEFEVLTSVYKNYNYKDLEKNSNALKNYLIKNGWKGTNELKCKKYPNIVINLDNYYKNIFDFNYKEGRTELLIYNIEQFEVLLGFYGNK